MTKGNQVTDDHTLEDELRDAVAKIREHWPALLTPTVGPRAGTPSTDTLTALERRILLRQLVDRVVVKWARTIARDRALTAYLPSTWDTDGMLRLIDRHAEWFAGQPDAKRAAQQLGMYARLVEETAQPRQRDHVYLGPCPFLHPDGDDPAIVHACRGRVLAPVAGDGFAYCTDCGQLTLVEWWRDVLGVTMPLASIPQLVPILHAKLGLRVTEQTLRNWRRAGRITPALRHDEHDPVPCPPFVDGIGPRLVWDLFDPQAVLEQVAHADRLCVMCDQPWDGPGDVCRRCWASTSRAKPAHAPDEGGPRIAGIPVTFRESVRRAERVVDPHDDDKPTRCHYSDLPVEQCSCGHEHDTA